MSRRDRSAEEQARRAKIRELLQESNISSIEDIQNLFMETIAEFIEKVMSTFFHKFRYSPKFCVKYKKR